MRSRDISVSTIHYEAASDLTSKLAHLHIPFEDIVSATNNFADDNLIKVGSISDVYKGKLFQSKGWIHVCIRRFRSSSGLVYREFLRETATNSCLNHRNTLSLVGFCDENGVMMMVFEYHDNGSLDKYLSDPTLLWSQRLKICLGAARALRYIHKDIEGHLVAGFHHDIKSSKILLDEDWEAKLFCFGFHATYDVIFYKKSIYIDRYNWNHESDVYSFGVILFEVLCGRKAEVGDGIAYKSLIAMVTHHYEEGKLDEIICPELRKQMHPQSLSIVSELAYNCVSERDKRPSMDLILESLQRALELPLKHENLEKDYAYLKIPLSDIILATENFATTHCIGSHRDVMVYKADLDHFDINSLLTTEVKNKGELPKMRGTVTIKRNISRNYGQVTEGFCRDIEMLAACKHPNIVSLVGFSWEESEMILVYEYASNGSLADYLGSINGRTNITWKQRIQICLDIAHGLQYIHTNMEADKPGIIPLRIYSVNVMLGENCETKIAYSQFFKFDSKSSTVYTHDNIAQDLEYFYSYINAGRRSIIHGHRSHPVVINKGEGYTDISGNRPIDFNPQSSTMNTSNSTRTNDMLEKVIYSFGVVLFEILCGRLAYDSIYIKEHDKGLARHFKEGTLKNMVDPKIMEEVHEHSYMIGPDQRSLDAFINIAYKCLSETEAERPTVEGIINTLNRALSFQVENLERLRIPLGDIVAATNNFTEIYIGEGGFGAVYRAELNVFDRRNSLATEMTNEDKLPKKRTVAIKRNMRKQDTTGFLAELEIIHRCEHPNIISLLGFCFEDSENILVFEYAANGSLDEYLEKGELSKLPWATRLEMCLDIAYGLSYLHSSEDEKKCIIHRDIKSGNILLDEKLKVKIADFGLSIFHPKNHPSHTINTEHCAGTDMYTDPEYQEGKLKIESDVYSFGVVLFEILSGKLAYDRIYTKENGNGIAPVARQRFKDRKLMEMVDIKIMEEAHELSSTIMIGPSQDSLDVFFEVAIKCLAEAQAGRPKMIEVINGLKKAIVFQKNHKDTLQILLEDIRLKGKNFSDTNCIIEKGYDMYNGEVRYGNEFKPVIIKRMSTCGREPPGSWREFEILFKLKHENVIGLVGYCKKGNENFIVYEYASNQSLDMHLGDAKFTWIKRLKIAVDIANGLNFLHGDVGGQDVTIHRDLKSSKILLTGDWKAKICGFDVSLICPNNQGILRDLKSLEILEKRDWRAFIRGFDVPLIRQKDQDIHYANDGIESSPGYCDPLYLKSRILTKESDIYSLGVILFELLCGRLACTDSGHFLDELVKGQYEVERPDKLVFERMNEQIVWPSLVTFTAIAFQCLHDKREKRPKAALVVAQLRQALEFQEAYEIWDAKLPKNYNEILEFSKSPEIYSSIGKKDIYNILSKGILLQEGKLWFSIGGNGERNEMISARMFSYKNRWSHRWRSIPESRFEKVAELSDISNLNIQIKISSQLLVPGVNYSVHLVFKFCCPRKSHAKRMYVNLKYTMGSENLSAYFATWREDGWMMIELCRFSNLEDKNIEVLLKSFSRCYCDSRAIYIEGIEFQAIDDLKQDEKEKSDKVQQQILKSNSEMDKAYFSPNKMTNMRHEVHAKWVLYGNSDVKLINSNSASQSRFEGIELLRQSAFRVKWKINSQMLSTNTEHGCYLVFKLSENCCGLHCPVIVRDQYHWKTKETLYFRHPKSWNLIDTDQVPKDRTDGWMEVIVWIYNSSSELRNESLYVNLKLTSYEGTMSGLIIRGLEFRPMEK